MNWKEGNKLIEHLLQKGDFETAKKIALKVISKKEYFDDAEIQLVKENLSNIYIKLGNLDEAKEILISLINDSNLSDIDISRIQSNLALVLKDLGDYQGAKELLEKAKKSAEKNFGEKHPTTAVSYSNLATVLQELGDYQGAKELLEKARLLVILI